MQETILDRGRFRTPHASRYLQQLCKHFAHKVEASFDATSGVIALPSGPVRLTAQEGELVATVTAPDAEGLARSRGIIDRHLERFAFREDFRRMDWSGTDAGTDAGGGRAA